MASSLYCFFNDRDPECIMQQINRDLARASGGNAATLASAQRASGIEQAALERQRQDDNAASIFSGIQRLIAAAVPGIAVEDAFSKIAAGATGNAAGAAKEEVEKLKRYGLYALIVVVVLLVLLLVKGN